MNRQRYRDYRYGEPYYKHFRKGKFITNEEDPMMHFQHRQSFFSDNPDPTEVTKSLSDETFDDGEYEEVLRKYSDGGVFSSDGIAREHRKQVENVKDKISSMKKKFQSLSMVCDYVEGMEKYEQALETDPDSKMVKELTRKLEDLQSGRNVPKIHTNEFSYARSNQGASSPKQYGVSVAERRRRAGIVNPQTSLLAPPCVRGHERSPVRSQTQMSSLAPPCVHGHERSPVRNQTHLSTLPPLCLHGHEKSPARNRAFVRSRTSSFCKAKAETKDAATQVGRPWMSSDSEDEKHRDSGVSTHDEDEEANGGRRKIDSRLKRELLKPKVFLDENGKLVRSASDDSLQDSAFETPAKSDVESLADSSLDAATLSPVKIYYDLVTSSSRALLLFLKKSGIAFDAVPIHLKSGAQFDPEFRRLSPALRLPVMDDVGFVLREAPAICRYLAARHRLSKRWLPSADDAKAVARVDEYLSWHQSRLRPACLQIFSQATVVPVITHQPPNYERLHCLKMELDKACDQLEEGFLSGEFIEGDEVGICDLLAVCELKQASGAGFDVESERRRIRIWMERVKNHAVPFFDEVNAEIDKIRRNKGARVWENYQSFVSR